MEDADVEFPIGNGPGGQLNQCADARAHDLAVDDLAMMGGVMTPDRAEAMVATVEQT